MVHFEQKREVENLMAQSLLAVCTLSDIVTRFSTAVNCQRLSALLKYEPVLQRGVN